MIRVLMKSGTVWEFVYTDGFYLCQQRKHLYRLFLPTSGDWHLDGPWIGRQGRVGMWFSCNDLVHPDRILWWGEKKERG